MDIRVIAPGYSVSPQIDPADCASIAEAGYKTLICNRPDTEVPASHSAAAMRAAAEAAGLTFIDNPVIGAALTMDAVKTQQDAIDAGPGPVLAYCASGTRSTVVWALSQAGSHPTDTLIEAAARAGYAIEGLRPQLDAIASRATN